MFKKIKFKNFYFYLFVFITFNSFLLIFFTPPSNIIFYDMDSRIMIDEIIQILNPSSVYDFIYDTAYGGRIIYGRFVYNFYALFTFFLNLFLSNFLTTPQIIMFINYNLLFLSFLILNKVFIKNIYFKLLIIFLMLTFEISSIISLKTTSLEIFLLSISIFYIYGSTEEINLNLKKSGFILGILFGIKFINAPYLGVLLTFVILSKKLIQKKHIFLYSIIGFLFAQPSVLVPQILKVYISDIIHHLNYQEGSYVSILDWLKVISRNFGSVFILLVLIFLIHSLYKYRHKFLLIHTLMPLAAIIQISALFFSDGLIRAHYLKMSIVLLIYFSLNITENYVKLKWLLLLVIMTFFFNISFILKRTPDFTLYHLKSMDEVDNAYLSLNQVSSMQQTLSYVKTISKQKGIPLIWWGLSEGTFFYPYSEFHWGSSEDPQNYDFYIKELYEGPDGFAFGNCKNYGGIVIFILNKNNDYVVQELLDNEFEFLKKYEIQDNQEKLSYGVFAKQNTGIPDDC